MTRRAAFFDLDETLIRVKSMFRFLEFHLTQRGLPAAVYERVRADLDTLAAAGRTRAQTNRAYYQVYANESVDRVTAHGELWFAGEQARGDLFTGPVLEALRAHQAAGDLIVLVSGSFPPCADPIARHVGADVVVCTRPEISHGCYTGRVDVPVIGPAKADAVRDVLRRYGIAADDCYAYGDHASDLPMLRSVGHPVVVGSDPVLDPIAHESGWARLEVQPV